MRTKAIVFFCILVLRASAAGPELFAQDTKMQAVGALASANLYLTYVSIGAAADSHSGELYQDEFAISLMANIIGLAKNTIGTLQKVLESEKLDEQDTRYVAETIDTLETLIEQAESYKKFVETKSAQYATIYNNYKQISWQKVAKLLGLGQKNPQNQTGK